MDQMFVVFLHVFGSAVVICLASLPLFWHCVHKCGWNLSWRDDRSPDQIEATDNFGVYWTRWILSTCVAVLLYNIVIPFLY